MRLLPILLCLSAILLLLSPSTAGALPPPPSDFDSTAPVPKNITLPAKLDIPANTHIEMTVTPKISLPPIPPSQMNNPCLLSNPLLESAVIESNQQDVHAVFHWQGGHSSEAFIIHGVCFQLINLAYPQSVTVTGSKLDIYLNRTISGEGDGGNFPGVSWYSPSNFAGTASLNGSSVLVFAPGGRKPKATTFPDGPSICLDATTLLPVLINTNVFIIQLTNTPAPNVEINPQGAYLQVIQKQFGHWP